MIFPVHLLDTSMEMQHSKNVEITIFSWQVTTCKIKTILKYKPCQSYQTFLHVIINVVNELKIYAVNFCMLIKICAGGKSSCQVSTC